MSWPLFRRSSIPHCLSRVPPDSHLLPCTLIHLLGSLPPTPELGPGFCLSLPYYLLCVSGGEPTGTGSLVSVSLVVGDVCKFVSFLQTGSQVAQAGFKFLGLAEEQSFSLKYWDLGCVP